jgi:hypothetical protein
VTSPLTITELEHLAEVREVCRTVNTSGWHRILSQIKAFVDEAQEDMVGAVYASDSIKAALQMRWQQRVAMLRGVEKYVTECENERDTLLEMSKEQPGVPRSEEYDGEGLQFSETA